MNKQFWLVCSAAALFVASAAADSLWRDDSVLSSMVADKKAHAVGDILTISVQENSSAVKNNNTTTSKQSDLTAALTAFLYSPAGSAFLTKKGQLPAMAFNSKQDFNGGGTVNNQEQIVANIPVTVVDVLPNQTLVVEGRRQTSFAGEVQDIVLRGTVRYDDISLTNTVCSCNVADATIKITNKGPVTDSQRKGWFTKLWEVLTPF
jgi:flagellar L-ring protein precursor FlgH